MARHYTVPVGSDAEQVVRKFYVDGAGTPIPGLTVTFSFRDSSGTALTTGTLAEVNGAIAPGWYKLPASTVLTAGGIYTLEYSPPAPFAVDADTIFVTSEMGRATTDFVRGG